MSTCKCHLVYFLHNVFCLIDLDLLYIEVIISTQFDLEYVRYD